MKTARVLICMFCFVSSILIAQDDDEIFSFKSVLDKLVNAEYSQINFYNLQNIDDMKEWHRTLSYPRNIRSKTSQLNTIKKDIKWVIRAIVTHIYKNKKYEKEYAKNYPEEGTDEHWELVKKTGGRRRYKTEYLYLYEMSNPAESIKSFLDNKSILFSGEIIHGVKLYTWVKNPFNVDEKRRAVISLMPNSNEIVMSTSKSLLVSQIEARIGLGELAGDNMENWSIFEPVQKHIEPGFGWGMYVGQDLTSWHNRSENVNKYTQEEMKKIKDATRFSHPILRVSVYGKSKENYLDRWVFLYDLNASEKREHAKRLKESKYRGMKKWAKDFEALSDSVNVRVEGDFIIQDMVLTSEYKAWAYSDPGFDHLDEKYSKKPQNLKKESKEKK